MNNTHKPPQGVRVIFEIRTQNPEIKAYIERKIRNAGKKLSPRTINTEIKAIETFYVQTRIQTLKEITLEACQDYCIYLREEYSKQTAYRWIDYMRTYLRHTGNREIAEQITNYQPPRKNPIILTDQEFKQLYESAKNYPVHWETQKDYYRTMYSAIVSLGVYGCLRKQEIINLELQDINLDSGEISIKESKGDKSREIVIPPHVREDIKTYLLYRPETESENLFVSIKTYEKLNDDAPNQIISRLASMAGIQKKITSHTLRRTGATNHAKDGMSPFVLQAFLGHSKLETTLKYVNFEQLKVKEHVLEKTRDRLGDKPPKPIKPHPEYPRPRYEADENPLKQLASQFLQGSIDIDTYKMLREDLNSDSRKEVKYEPGMFG